MTRILEPVDGGHGRVVPRADGKKARCDGPGKCLVCIREEKLLACAEGRHEFRMSLSGPDLCGWCGEPRRRA